MNFPLPCPTGVPSTPMGCNCDSILTYSQGKETELSLQLRGLLLLTSVTHLCCAEGEFSLRVLPSLPTLLCMGNLIP